MFTLVLMSRIKTMFKEANEQRRVSSEQAEPMGQPRFSGCGRLLLQVLSKCFAPPALERQPQKSKSA